MGVKYEWKIEEIIDVESRDIGEVHHSDTLSDLLSTLRSLRLNNPGMVSEICLVRNAFMGNGEEEDLDNRQHAYLSTELATLPETFDGGATVPRKFHEEFKKSIRHYRS